MQLMFSRLLGIEMELCSQTGDFLSYQGPKLSYGLPLDDKTLFFGSHPLLFERKVSVQDTNSFEYQGEKAFFAVNDSGSALPFDLFAAAFYLVSRYEEYLPHDADEFGRFRCDGSLAWREGFLHKPLLNIWAGFLQKILGQRFPELPFKLPEFSFTPTIDVDSAYAHRHKGLTRASGGIWQCLRRREWQEIALRLKVLAGIEPDPFDTFDLQLRLQQKYGYRPYYFFLLADYGLNDKNISYNNRYFRQLIQKLADYSEIGIHPSFASAAQPGLVQIECARLQAITNREVLHSRQHFLMLRLPNTYQTLINNDIAHDFTMGYPDRPGFRASICIPFPFYDLVRETATDLMVHPFALMDGAFLKYHPVSVQQGIQTALEIMDSVKKTGGDFSILWHNPTFDWPSPSGNWLEAFEAMAKHANFLSAKHPA